MLNGIHPIPISRHLIQQQQRKWQKFKWFLLHILRLSNHRAGINICLCKTVKFGGMQFAKPDLREFSETYPTSFSDIWNLGYPGKKKKKYVKKVEKV